MKTTLTLGIIQTRPIVVINPYWFTVDGTIHLGGKNTSVEIDLDKQSQQNLFEIVWGIKNNLLQSTVKVEDIASLINVETLPAVKNEEKAVPSKKEVDAKRKDKKVDEILDMLKQSAMKLKSVIGSAEIFGDTLGSGINDYQYLKEILEVETNNANRKTIKDMLNARMEAVKSISIEITEEELAIEEVEDKKIMYNPESNTLDEVKE